MTDAAVLVIVVYLNIIASYLRERFSDLRLINVPTWVMLPMLVDISGPLLQYQEELSKMQNDESVKSLLSI